MGSITFGGFNSIDFTAILEAVMTQESLPLTNLKTQQTTLASKSTNFSTLATKLSAFETAIGSLTDDSTLLGRKVSNTAETSVSVSAGSAAVAGIYDITVEELARAQVTASTSKTKDADETVVAWGGTLSIGGVPVTIDAPVTLKGLAEKINTTKNIGVTATVVKSGVDEWQLVLTGRGTGTANAFTVTNSLTGGSGVGFGDGDGNGISGDTPADNAVNATDARALINNVEVVSSTNTIEDAISGASITLLKKDPAAVATVTIAEDVGTAKTRLQSVVDSFNDLVKFIEDQNTAAANGNAASLARDPLLRGLRNSLRTAITAEYESGGDVASLAAIGIEFQKTGRLTFSGAKFETAASTSLADVRRLLTGDGTSKGVFPTLEELVKTYTKTDGLLKDTKDRLSAQQASLQTRIDDLTSRLAVRRATLQKEYIAADATMTQLKNDVSSLSSLNGQYRLF